MRTIPGKAWLLIAFSAFLQIIVFPVAGPVSRWLALLSWVALVPFLLALLAGSSERKTLRMGQSAMLGYACGIAWYMGNCAWIFQTMYLYGGLPKPVAFLILVLFSCYLGLYHALFASLFALVLRSKWGSTGALTAAPFLWVAVELLRARITGFPWDLLGYTQVSNLLVTRLAPITGVMGISFLLVAANSLFCWSIICWRKGGRLVIAGTLAGVLLLQFVGWAQFFEKLDRPQEDQTAVLMQENLAVGATGREVRPLTLGEEFQSFSQASLAPYRYTGKAWSREAGKTDLLVWPEAPSHFQSNDPAFRAVVSQLAHTLAVPVIAGSLGVDADASAQRGYLLFDSASLFTPDGTYSGRYDKIHLVPWGEYVPFKQLFAFAQKLTEGVGDMDPGTTRSVFRSGGHSYGVFICYESIFGTEVREFAKNGADVLVNISDDGWYGDSGAPWQHLNMARMRAIENHRYVLRATNTGVTTVIDARGRIRSEAPRHVRAAFAFPFAIEAEQTIYTRFGDWFAWLCVLVSAVWILLAWRSHPRGSVAA